MQGVLHGEAEARFKVRTSKGAKHSTCSLLSVPIGVLKEGVAAYQRAVMMEDTKAR